MDGRAAWARPRILFGWLVWIFFMHPGCILTHRTALLAPSTVQYGSCVTSGEQRGATTTDAHGIRRKRTERRNRTMNHRNTCHPSLTRPATRRPARSAYGISIGCQKLGCV